jgi:hypothetical protein
MKRNSTLAELPAREHGIRLAEIEDDGGGLSGVRDDEAFHKQVAIKVLGASSRVRSDSVDQSGAGKEGQHRQRLARLSQN